MRRAALIAVTVLVVAAMPVSAAPTPGAGVAAFQMADAAWIVPEDKNNGAFYFALAMRIAPTMPEGLSTFGVVGKGRCFSGGGRNHGFTVCTASGRGRSIDLMDFEMDPVLETARLTLESQGFTHTVEWEGQGDVPDASGGAQVGSGGVSAGAGLARWAVASGEVFGQKLSRRSDVFSFLMQGAIGDAWLTTTGYTFHDDGRVTLRRVFR